MSEPNSQRAEVEEALQLLSSKIRNTHKAHFFFAENHHTHALDEALETFYRLFSIASCVQQQQQLS